MSSQFSSGNAVGNAVKGFTEVHTDTFPAFFSSTKQITLSQKEIRVVKQDLSLMSSCWLGLLPWSCCMCCMMALRMLHKIPQHWDQAGSSLDPPLALLLDGHGTG